MTDLTNFDGGVAGASARREGERRSANREKRVRDKHPHLGGIILALQDQPQHERSRTDGAAGEQAVAESLAKRCPDVPFLHDRRIPGTRANIDHIAVAPSGVWVIDAKAHKGKVEVRKPLFGQARLLIRGRDQSKLIDGLDKQVTLVREALGPEVSVQEVLCMTQADLPLLGTTTFRGYPLLSRKAIAKRLNATGNLTQPAIQALAHQIARQFPNA